MGDIRTHRDLDVWKEGIELVVKVYEIAQKFPMRRDMVWWTR